MQLLVATSQMRTVRSSLPETTNRPSGLNWQVRTQLLWPVKLNRKRCAGRDQTYTEGVIHSRLCHDVGLQLV